MAVIYPVDVDAPDDIDRGYADFASELSDQWVVEVRVEDEEGESDPALFGPFGPRDAWDLANELEDLKGDKLTIVIDALYRERDPRSILAALML